MKSIQSENTGYAARDSGGGCATVVEDAVVVLERLRAQGISFFAHHCL